MTHDWFCKCGQCPDPEAHAAAKAKALRWYVRWVMGR